jgi:hypothetical protein
MVFHELAILTSFMEYCDSLGIPIFGDSQIFRDQVVNTQSADAFYKSPHTWPNPQALNLMAMAQHHGVPTRLLDWAVNPFTALYFAASGAVGRYETWSDSPNLAIWMLDRSALAHHSEVVLHTAPGSVSKHLAAQGGLFTVHPHSGLRHGSFEVLGFEEYLADIPSPLFKLTLPAYEAVRLMRLCGRVGINAARVYPSIDGAGRAVVDDMKMSLARSHWNKTEILVRF